MIPLTEQAHAAVRAILRPGDTAIDATTGNGHDTLFLAHCVGPAGTVYGFDIQSTAIEQTALRLEEAGLTHVILMQTSHAEMSSAIPEHAVGRVNAVMFNLGYLPGGDRRLITQPETTLAAIRAGLTLLAAGGILTVLAYPGHHGGANEALAVEHDLNQLPQDEFKVTGPPTPIEAAAPRLLIVRKQPCRPAEDGDSAGRSL